MGFFKIIFRGRAVLVPITAFLIFSLRYSSFGIGYGHFHVFYFRGTAADLDRFFSLRDALFYPIISLLPKSLPFIGGFKLLVEGRGEGE